MFFFLRTFKFLTAHAIQAVFAFILLHFFVSWGLMAYFEAGKDLIKPENYFYFYLTTISTVGYGDLSPATLGGKMVTGFVLYTFGIAIFGFIVTVLSVFGTRIHNYVLGGRMPVKFENHTLVMGFHERKTQDIFKQLRDNCNGEAGKLVLCVSDMSSVELKPEWADGFFKGTLRSDDMMNLSSVAKATSIVINGKDDNQTTNIALKVIRTLKAVGRADDIQIVTTVHGGGENVRDMSDNCEGLVECVDADDAGMIANAVQDPGSSELLKGLGTNNDGREVNRFYIPANVASFKFVDLQHLLAVEYNTLLLDVLESHKHRAKKMDSKNMNVGEITMKGGMSFFYSSYDRIPAIDFSSL